MLKKLQARIKSLLSKGDNISHSEITELERFKNDIDLEGQIKSFLDKMKDKFTSGKANTTEKNSNSETLDLVPNSCFQSYREDGVTPKSSRDKEGNVTYYREDGKTVDSVHSADGSWYHYREDGYPIVKSVAKWFSVKMTKEIFAGAIKKAIPVVGGVIGGGITFVSFKPCCDKLKVSLQNTMLSNPDYNPTAEVDDLVIIDADLSDADTNNEPIPE